MSHSDLNFPGVPTLWGLSPHRPAPTLPPNPSVRGKVTLYCQRHLAFAILHSHCTYPCPDHPRTLSPSLYQTRLDTHCYRLIYQATRILKFRFVFNNKVLKTNRGNCFSLQFQSVRSNSFRFTNNTEKNSDSEYCLTFPIMCLHSPLSLTVMDSFQYLNELNSCLQNREGTNI